MLKIMDFKAFIEDKSESVMRQDFKGGSVSASLDNANIKN
jgi:hypothetical protein